MKSSVLNDASDHISEQALENSAACRVPTKSILIVVRSGILAHTLPVAQVARPLAFNQDIKALIPKPDKIDPDYLFWFIRSQQTRVLTQGVKKGATVHSLQSGFIENLSVPVPERAEQRRVADLLWRAESIIRLRREAQKKAADLVPTIFIDLFGDPASNPKSWPIVSVGDVLAEPPTLGTMAKPSATAGRWLDLRVANIQGGRLDLSDQKWLDLPDEHIARFSLRPGDLLLARAIGSLDHLGKTVIVDPPSPWTFDSHLMRLRLTPSKILPEFFKAFLESKSGREEFLKHTRRSAVQFNINGKEIRKISIPLPPGSLQSEFVAQCQAVQGLAALQAKAFTTAEASFQSLLSSAFSGECKRIGANMLRGLHA